MLQGPFTPSATAPRLAGWTKTGGPGDVITLKGGNLSQSIGATYGDDLKVWVHGPDTSGHGVMAEAEIELLQPGQIAVRLPDNLLPDAVYTVWASHDGGFGEPVSINAPELWWIGPDQAAPGQVTSLYGHNLAITDKPDPTVNVELTDGPEAGRVLPVEVTAADPYRVDILLPETMPAGTYKIHLNNGAGGNCSWERPDDLLQVNETFAADWQGTDHVVLNAAGFGAVAGDGLDDRTALQNAIQAAHDTIATDPAVEEVTVKLSTGTYELSSPLRAAAGVRLQGDSRDGTILTASTTYVKREGAEFGSLIEMFEPFHNPLMAGGRQSAVTDMTLKVKDTAADIGIDGHHGTNLLFDNLSVNAQGRTAPLKLSNASYVTLEDSVITGPHIFLGNGRQIQIRNNDFYGTDQTEANILTFGASQVAVSGNTARHLTDNPTATTVWTEAYQGRFYVAQTHWGAPGQQYIANNQTFNLAPHVEFAADGLHLNAGEQILFEGPGNGHQISPDEDVFGGATTTTWTLDLSAYTSQQAGLFDVFKYDWINEPDWETRATTAFSGMKLTIAGGAGAGQTVTIKAYDPTTQTFTFRETLSAPPDDTSILLLNTLPDRIAIVGNTLDGRAENVAAPEHSGSVGVSFFGGGSNAIIDGNQVSDVRTGIDLWSLPVAPGTDALSANPIQWLDIKNNGFVNNLNAITFIQESLAGDTPGLTTYQDIFTGNAIRHNTFTQSTDSIFKIQPRDLDTTSGIANNIISKNTFSTLAGDLVTHSGGPSGNAAAMILDDQTGLTLTAHDLGAASAVIKPFAWWPDTPTVLAHVKDDGTIDVTTRSGTLDTTADGAERGTLSGTALNDVMFGTDNPRAEHLSGGAGDDAISGMDGNDILDGGTGHNLLIGGPGADGYVFGADAVGNTADIVRGFSSAEGDKIRVNGLIAASVTDSPFTLGYLSLNTVGTDTHLLYDADGQGDNYSTLAVIEDAAVTQADVMAIPDGATVFDFELGLTEGNETPLTYTTYGGFTWKQTGVYHEPGWSTLGYADTSGTNLAFIAEMSGHNVEGYDNAEPGTPATFFSGTPFDLISANFSSAFADTLTVTARAYSDEDGTALVGTQAFTVDKGDPQTVSFLGPNGDFANIKRVEFLPTDPGGGINPYFGFDDLVVYKYTGMEL